MRALFASPALYLGLLAGVIGGRYFFVSSPPAESMRKEREAPTSPDFSWLDEGQIREYYELKTMKERYEKADELLGRFVLALIAGRLMDVSDSTRNKIARSAEGRREELPAPICAPAPANTNVPVAASVPATPPPPPGSTPSGKSSLTPASGSTGATGNASESKFEPGQTESFPFNSTTMYKSTMCRGESGWFVVEAQRARYAAEPIGEEDAGSELLGTLASDSLQRSKIGVFHCLAETYKDWRVRFTFMAKAEGVRKARFQSRSWKSDGTIGGGPRNVFPLEGTYGWRPVSISAIMLEESFAAGFELDGPGKLWIRDFKVVRVADTKPYD